MHDSELIDASIKNVRSIDRNDFVSTAKNQARRYQLGWSLDDMECAKRK